jgi:hypothetical protein
LCVSFVPPFASGFALLVFPLAALAGCPRPSSTLFGTGAAIFGAGISLLPVTFALPSPSRALPFAPFPLVVVPLAATFGVGIFGFGSVFPSFVFASALSIY